MKNKALILTMVLLIYPLLCANVWAQATAQISGTVRDQSGAVLPGVEVKATQTETGLARTTVTNETGSYVLPNLPLGPYKLEAALAGFRTFVQSGIMLQVNANQSINPMLELGQVSELVEVQANAAAVETRSSTVSQVVENARILELPLNGRLVTDLIGLSGVAITTTTSTGRLFNDLPNISVGGSLSYATDYTLDGATHMNFLNGSTMPMPFPNATQEFKVESTGVMANRGSSSAVAAVTKSGTNEIHGDLFEFLRNDLFNATQYFAAVDPNTGKKVHSTLKRNQFGGTLGGPIVKNKLFFFGGYQGTTLRQDPINNQQFIATPAMLAGNWTAFASPACNAGVQRVLRAPFVAGPSTPNGTTYTIDPSQYSRVATYISNKILASQSASPSDCGLVTVGAPVQRNDGLYIGKVDYQKSSQHSLFGRVLFNSQYQPDSGKLTTNLLPAVGGTDALASSYSLGDTYLITSSMVNAFRASVNRVGNHQTAKQYFSLCDAGATDMYCGYTPKWISGLTITGGFTGFGVGVPTGTYWNPVQYSINDDVSWLRGTHEFAFGVGAGHGRFTELANFLSGGSFVFTGAATGMGMGDFLTGRVGTFQQGAPNKNDVHETRINLYMTDSWKALPRLTVNYGLRWEPYLPQSVPDQAGIPGPVYNFSHDRFIQGIYSTVFKNAPAGFYYTGDPGFPERTGINARWLQFAPRLGFAWDVTGKGKTSLRASYAFGYAFVPGDWREDTSGSIPWGGRVSVASPPANQFVGGALDAPWRGLTNPYPIVFDLNAPFLPRGQYKSDPLNLTNPQTYSWNLSLQHQLASNWLMSASYIATRTLHIWTMNAINPAVFIPGNCSAGQFGLTAPGPCSTPANLDARRILSLERPVDGDKIGPLGQMDDGGYSTYHAMLVSLERRAARNLTFATNYTLSHCIGPFTPTQILKLSPDATYSKPNDREFDRGNCLSDRRQVFTFSAVAETPQFSNSILRKLGSAWKVSPLYRFASGQPLDVVSGVDQALNGVTLGSSNSTLRQRPNQVLENPYLDGSARPYTQWVNLAAFALPAPGSYGNLGYDALVGPHTWSFDAALSRTFNIREMQRIEVRVEAFNVLNSFRPGCAPGATGCPTGGVNTTLNSNTFGQIRNALDPRIMQFALKYAF